MRYILILINFLLQYGIDCTYPCNIRYAASHTARVVSYKTNTEDQTFFYFCGIMSKKVNTTAADSSSTMLTSSKRVRSNKFGGSYENGKKFTKEKWAEICSIYTQLEQNQQRRPTRKELAKAAQVSENSARRAIRMVKTGCCHPRFEADERTPKQVQKVDFKTSTNLPQVEQDNHRDLLQLVIQNALLDHIQLQQRIYNTLKSCNWKLITLPSPFFSINVTKCLVKEFRHLSLSDASNFVSIVKIAANKYGKVSPPRITLHKSPFDGMLITRVECHTPQSKEGVTINDFCTAMSIDILATDLDSNSLL